MSPPPNPLWFEKGELREISSKFAGLKYFDESSICELNVLLTLALSVLSRASP
jgi:hypothetical protein